MSWDVGICVLSPQDSTFVVYWVIYPINAFTTVRNVTTNPLVSKCITFYHYL